MWFYILNTIGAFFLAEFITGMVYFVEDTYGTQVSNKLIQKHIIIPNLEHHYNPLKMTKKTWLQTIKATTIAMGYVNFIILIIYPRIIFHYFYGMTSIFICSANLIHKWAHTPKKSLPRFVQVLQDNGILQTHYNHSLHHLELNSDYCVMSNLMNYPLNYIGFWNKIELLMIKIFDIHPRIEKTLNLKGELII
jgi:hypothetical protein